LDMLGRTLRLPTDSSNHCGNSAIFREGSCSLSSSSVQRKGFVFAPFHSFKRFGEPLGSKAEVLERIVELKSRGLSHISINTHLRCVNAYLMWLHNEQQQPLSEFPG
jgi:hypothetical protein